MAIAIQSYSVIIEGNGTSVTIPPINNVTAEGSVVTIDDSGRDMSQYSKFNRRHTQLTYQIYDSNNVLKGTTTELVIDVEQLFFGFIGTTICKIKPIFNVFFESEYNGEITIP